GGNIAGRGRYAYDGSGDLTVSLNRLDALQRSDVTAILSGDLSLTQGQDRAEVTGDLTFDRVEIDLGQLPQAGYTTLDVRFADAVQTSDAEPEPPLDILLDLNLEADRRIFISGQGLTSEWQLDAQIGGTAAAPQIIGQAGIVRGDLDFLGRTFVFRDSTIRLNGNPTEARLALRAERIADDFTAAVLVTGQPTRPDISLTSEPNLPEDEVISRVLFGRSPAELTPLQAAQLAAAVASLASGGGGFDPVGRLQDALNVDRLEVGVSDSGAASIGAGKYIAEDVYVQLQTDARGESGLGIDWTPRQNLEIGTEVTSDQSARFDVRWRRDFNLGGRASAGPEDEAPEDEQPAEPVDP
ncbi:MAG: translocation/assembly module TamB domain-containing protein, partial [Pseudomonadota bacterium]